jgi:FixJ family two-component response regulator
MPKRSTNVVVVDDDVEMGQAVARLVKAAGFHALAFKSAQALLEADPIAPADCFILDIHMPGMSGFELANRLRALGVRSPIIFITAHDDPLSRGRAHDVGAIGYVLKPFGSESLLPLVARACAQGQ